VIAEGVEDINELNALKDLGCEQFQGYLFDKPLAVAEIEQRFRDNPYKALANQSEIIRLGNK
jgi:EAL domain-containing protein (putative c-di-GMP-specific phosphodiesterase class I)